MRFAILMILGLVVLLLVTGIIDITGFAAGGQRIPKSQLEAAWVTLKCRCDESESRFFSDLGPNCKFDFNRNELKGDCVKDTKENKHCKEIALKYSHEIHGFGSLSDICNIECVSDENCGGGRVCETGKCVIPPECVTDADCSGGEQCISGECVPIPPECVNDSDCLGGQVCVDGSCVAPEPEPECVDDSDCPTGQICSEGVCVGAPPKECIDGATCIDSRDCGPGGDPCIAGKCFCP